MSGRIEVPAGESGVVRVFSVDLPPEEAKAFAGDSGLVARALGLDGVEGKYVEVFPVSDLTGLGLSSYLGEGHGVGRDALGEDAARLDRLTGHVAVVSSGAFGGAAAELTVVAPLELVGSYAEDRPPVRFEPLPSGGAEGVVAGGAPVSPGPRKRAHPWILVIGAAVLVGLFIWLGGGR